MVTTPHPLPAGWVAGVKALQIQAATTSFAEAAATPPENQEESLIRPGASRQRAVKAPRLVSGELVPRFWAGGNERSDVGVVVVRGSTALTMTLLRSQ